MEEGGGILIWVVRVRICFYKYLVWKREDHEFEYGGSRKGKRSVHILQLDTEMHL